MVRELPFLAPCTIKLHRICKFFFVETNSQRTQKSRGKLLLKFWMSSDDSINFIARPKICVHISVRWLRSCNWKTDFSVDGFRFFGCDFCVGNFMVETRGNCDDARECEWPHENRCAKWKQRYEMMHRDNGDEHNIADVHARQWPLVVNGNHSRAQLRWKCCWVTGPSVAINGDCDAG